MIPIIEEYFEESKSDKLSVMSNLRVLLIHMLKCKYQNNYPTKISWRRSIDNSFNNIVDILDLDSINGFIVGRGSLFKKFYMRELNLDTIYNRSVRTASQETGIPVNKFPKNCEWTKEQLIDADFIYDFIMKYGQDL